mmetsp:Transcript_75282/g.166312  ORF Transcript_75282/g.166312 Transcript_75282/m.166312 type:complete len:261 (-) Transcript_75282:390-1172(-)
MLGSTIQWISPEVFSPTSNCRGNLSNAMLTLRQQRQVRLSAAVAGKSSTIEDHSRAFTEAAIVRTFLAVTSVRRHTPLHLAALVELTRHRAGVVGQIHTGISISKALRVEQMIQLSGQRLLDLTPLPVVQGVSGAHLLFENFHQSIRNKAFVTRKHIALEGDIAVNQLLHRGVRDAFAQPSPAHRAEPRRIVVAAHSRLRFRLISGAMLLHTLFLSLPNRSHHLAALLPSEEVGTKLALVKALVLRGVADDVMIRNPIND